MGRLLLPFKPILLSFGKRDKRRASSLRDKGRTRSLVVAQIERRLHDAEAVMPNPRTDTTHPTEMRVVRGFAWDAKNRVNLSY